MTKGELFPSCVPDPEVTSDVTQTRDGCTGDLILLAVCAWAAPALQGVDCRPGQNGHDWKSTTPVLKKLLEETKLFAVDRDDFAQGEDMTGSSPGKKPLRRRRQQLSRRPGPPRRRRPLSSTSRTAAGSSCSTLPAPRFRSGRRNTTRSSASAAGGAETGSRGPGPLATAAPVLELEGKVRRSTRSQGHRHS